MRLLAGIATGIEGLTIFTGAQRSLRRRPMKRIMEPLRLTGVEIRRKKRGFLSSFFCAR